MLQTTSKTILVSITMFLLVGALYLSLLHTHWLIGFWQCNAFLATAMVIEFCLSYRSEQKPLVWRDLLKLFGYQMAWWGLTSALIHKCQSIIPQAVNPLISDHAFDSTWVLLLPASLFSLAGMVLQHICYQEVQPAFLPQQLFGQQKKHPGLFCANALKLIIEGGQIVFLVTTWIVAFLALLGERITFWLTNPLLSIVVILLAFSLHQYHGRALLGRLIRARISLALIVSGYTIVFYAGIMFIQVLMIDVFAWQEPPAYYLQQLIGHLLEVPQQSLSLFYIGWCLLSLYPMATFVARYSCTSPRYGIFIVMMTPILCQSVLNISNYPISHALAPSLILVAWLLPVRTRSDLVLLALKHHPLTKKRSLLKSVESMLKSFLFNIALIFVCGWTILALQFGIMAVLGVYLVGSFFYYLASHRIS